MSRMNRDTDTEIFGVVERITFQNDDNGYTVAKLSPHKRGQDLVCIIGSMPGLRPGESVRCHGQWKIHKVHGSQFEVDRFTTEAPSDLAGIEKYLGSGLIRGIGATYAKRIVRAFKEKTLQIIDETPERLAEVPGIGKKRAGQIIGCWQEQRSVREVMIFLQSHGVSPTFAQKIFKVYGQKSITKVQEDPYSLAQDIFGIGFKKADQIAESLGIEKNSPRRIEAGIIFSLTALSTDGHVCFPVEAFTSYAAELLEVDRASIGEGLRRLRQQTRIEILPQVHCGELQDTVWLMPLYRSEVGIARECLRIKEHRSKLRTIDVQKAVDWAEDKLGISLAQHQAEAVAAALSNKMQVITGGPGTGKSTITAAILKILEKLTTRIVLAAPTGRAAKRMTEVTGKKASTIHSLLSWDFKTGGFRKNRKTPLEADVLIVDEASMIDTHLMNSLLRAVPDACKVILVGDIDQLPSVGPGNVLRDLIDSGEINVSQLTEVFRQAQGSNIITNAHRVNKGQFPTLKNSPDSDFFFIEADDNEDVLKQIIGLVTDRLPKRYRLNPVDEIQVLSPMNKGVIGAINLNTTLQDHLNPRGEALFAYGRRFKVADKVMQIRNNYNREVYNGDIGRVEHIDHANTELIALIDGKEVVYPFSDLDELVLAYAVSVHKYQGSECPAIVMPISTSHFKLLHRNLFYTGITRGKKLVVLVGSKKAVAMAVRNDEVQERHTGLKQTIVECSGTQSGAGF